MFTIWEVRLKASRQYQIVMTKRLTLGRFFILLTGHVGPLSVMPDLIQDDKERKVYCRCLQLINWFASRASR